MIDKTGVFMKTVNVNFVYHKSHNILDIAENLVNSQKNGASIIIPHICNNQNLFVGGLSKILTSRYPKIKANFEVVGKQQLGKTQLIKALDGFSDQSLYIANMIVQDKQNKSIKYLALVKCMDTIKSYVNQLNQQQRNVQIHIAENDFPCDKHEFEVIRNIMQDIWFKIPIYIY